MKNTISKIVLLVFIGISGCSSGQNLTPIPTLVLDSLSAPNLENLTSVTASGQVVPIENVSLSYPFTGIVATVDVKMGEDVTQGQVLVTLDDSVLKAQAAEAQANLNATQTQYDYLKRVGTDEEHLNSAQADIDRSQAAFDSANAILRQATLKAPFSGTIAAVEISPAETVVPGQVVIVIGDLSGFQVETSDLGERDIPNVQVGQDAEVYIEALNQTVAGTVVEVAGLSETLGGDVVYKVTIDLDDQTPGLYWGMSAEVEINTGKNQ
jgi:RND family efflux transporter MFP subunit